MDDLERIKQEHLKRITRRHFFKQASYGIGSLALSSLLNETLFAAAAGASTTSAARSTHPMAPPTRR